MFFISNLFFACARRQAEKIVRQLGTYIVAPPSNSEKAHTASKPFVSSLRWRRVLRLAAVLWFAHSSAESWLFRTSSPRHSISAPPPSFVWTNDKHQTGHKLSCLKIFFEVILKFTPLYKITTIRKLQLCDEIAAGFKRKGLRMNKVLYFCDFCESIHPHMSENSTIKKYRQSSRKFVEDDADIEVKANLVRVFYPLICCCFMHELLA